MVNRLLGAVVTSALLVFPGLVEGQDLSPSASRLKSDVTYLADDAREGRAPGTPGIEASAQYIADSFRASGLKPAEGGQGYFQDFTIRGEPKLFGTPTLTLEGPDGKTLEGRQNVDFTPLIVGGSGDPSGLPVVFAGYGISARDDKDAGNYDDYADLDVSGKAVLLFRHAPRQDEPNSRFQGARGTQYATFRQKVRTAARLGAKTVLLVNDRAGLKGKPDELLPFDKAGATSARIPFLMVTRDFAERLMAASGLPGLDELEDAYRGETPPAGRPLNGWGLNASVDVRPTTIATRNVIGVLEGSGPLANETIVVGGHYDHLGRGGPGSLAPGSDAIHNGADDNASGTSMVMELARRLGHRLDPPPRRIVFVAFSGEERGLLGSAHYVSKPPFPLAETVLMLNFDMVGRLGDKDDLSVYGTNSATGLDSLVDVLGKDEGFRITKSGGLLSGDRFGMASDHASFMLRGVPYLFFFTGVHRDYHRPSDDTDTLNFPGMARVADLGELILLDATRRPRRLEATKLAQNPHQGGHDPAAAAPDPNLSNSPRSAYFGSIPDYGADSGVAGVKLSGVADGGPAQKAGVQAGDVVVKFGGEPIETLEDYTDAIGRHKPGDQVEVVVKRDGKDLTLSVTLGSRGEAAK